MSLFFNPNCMVNNPEKLNENPIEGLEKAKETDPRDSVDNLEGVLAKKREGMAKKKAAIEKNPKATSERTKSIVDVEYPLVAERFALIEKIKKSLELSELREQTEKLAA